MGICVMKEISDTAVGIAWYILGFCYMVAAAYGLMVRFDAIKTAVGL